jgi:hypothetical protein
MEFSFFASPASGADLDLVNAIWTTALPLREAAANPKYKPFRARSSALRLPGAGRTHFG